MQAAVTNVQAFWSAHEQLPHLRWDIRYNEEDDNITICTGWKFTNDPWTAIDVPYRSVEAWCEKTVALLKAAFPEYTVEYMWDGDLGYQGIIFCIEHPETMEND